MKGVHHCLKETAKVIQTIVENAFLAIYCRSRAFFDERFLICQRMLFSIF